MPFAHYPRQEVLASLSNLKRAPFWLDDPSRPEPSSSLTSSINADLAIVGAGFTGLWTALLAKEADPSRDVILLEGDAVASAASGRNGGFMDHCLTHTFENGLARWPRELSTLIKMGYDNLNAIESTIRKYNIDCDFLRSGEIVAATEACQVEDLCNTPEIAAKYGYKVEWLEQDQLRGIVNSPTYLGGLLDRAVAMVNPARLAWGLRRACLELGVRLFEQTQVVGFEEDASWILLKTHYGQIRAKRVALATNAFPPLLKHISHYIVPVYDYALMTEPLTDAQRESIGWYSREGVGDAGNQFHYYRTTEDGRILWGGYDAIYYWNNGIGPHLENNPEAWARLADHFFQTFPQLEGLRFTHAWGGAIDTCSRFSSFWGRAYRGRVAYALGYTGLGVGASRFGALVMLDLLDGKDTERTRLKMAHSRPFPFPPEPVRSIVINLTRRSMDRADRNEGRRNLWLKTLDAFGLGFDS
jgi:glycine/D-amino acid oxidase-like deaminating enzyme